MNELHIYIVLHILCVTIWVGGHLIISLLVLPGALRDKSATGLLEFERKYEPLGMPALVILVATGIRMAYIYQVKMHSWFSFSSQIETVVSLKLLCLLGIVVLALNANLRVIPALKKSNKYLPVMAWHIIGVTTLSLIMLTLGTFIRYGGI